MVTKQYAYSIISIFLGTLLQSQITLKVKELDYESNKDCIPKNIYALDIEKKYKGHVIEISICNNSHKSVSFPLDTISYALPFTDEIDKYYNKNNVNPEPDLFNVLGVYPFIYQGGNFISNDFNIVPDPLYVTSELEEKNKIKSKRLAVIKNWREINNLHDDLYSVYNRYLNKNIITLYPQEEFKYKIYFNPYLKRQDLYNYHEFYWPLNPNLSYEVNFKLIIVKNLYRFLTNEDKRKYQNLFIGNVVSNTLKMITKTEESN